MKATDITWGGEVKCEFKVDGTMPCVNLGTLINLEYDYVSQKYSMTINGNKYLISPLGTINKAVLEEYISHGSWQANLIRVIDVQESNIIVQMHIFFAVVDFNELQKFKYRYQIILSTEYLYMERKTLLSLLKKSLSLIRISFLRITLKAE